MNAIKNMKTRSKLLSAFISVAVLVLLVGVVCIAGTKKMEALSQTMYEDNLVPAIDLSQIDSDLAEIRIGALQIVNEPDAAKRRELFTNATDHMKEIEALSEKYGATYLDTEEKSAFESFKSAWKKYEDTIFKTYGPALNGNFEAARANSLNGAASLYRAAAEGVDKLEDIQAKTGKELRKEAQEEYRFLRNISVGVVVIALLIALGLGMALSNMIARPLQNGLVLAESIARGDLTCNIEETGRTDEVGQLLSAMKNMETKLKGIIVSIKSTSDNVASSSRQLNSSSEQMKNGIGDQAGRATQIATSANEMSHTVVDIAKNASDIENSATETTKIAKDGQEIVARSVQEVKAIADTVSESARLILSLGDRSKHIGEIIGVIKDIADQTNLLALNAAIEAARAGEQGRGFAVVADEVRKLAERTAKATSEIGDMIGAIQKEVGKAVASMEEGTKRVDTGVEFTVRAGGALGEIVNSVDQLHSMVQQIASATEEMSTVSDHISGDIESIAEVSKNNSGNSDQIAQASSHLARLSTELQGIVGQFRV